MDRRLHFRTLFLGDRWARDVRVRIGNGRVAALEEGVQPEAADEAHTIGLPGLPNLHSHAFQRAMAGLAERRGSDGADSFWTWREAMYRFVDHLGPDALEAIAALAYIEMLETGFTRVGEFHYLHNDSSGVAFADPAEMSAAIARAAATSGIGLTLLPVFYAHSAFGGALPTHAQRRFINGIESFTRLLEACAPHLEPLGDAVLGLAPHSLRAVTPGELSTLDANTKGPLHIHIAEQTKEVDDCVAWSGQRPVEWLLANQSINERWCLVHATHMTESETDTLARSGAVVGLCPITEANLGDGIFPAKRFLEAGGRFGVGSDSNVRIDAAEELRLLEYGQRLVRRERNVLARPEQSVGAALYTGAVKGGAQALGVQAGIAIGAPADIVSLNTNAAALAARDGDTLLDSYVFAGRDLVDCVWRAGEKVVAQGRHRARDAVQARFNATLKSLLA